MSRTLRSQHWAFQAGDDSILRALESGAHEDSLREFFGVDAYTDLSALAQQAEVVRQQRAARRSSKAAPQVLILPGIMGSKLGRPRGRQGTARVLWIDPLRIAAGQLTQLALPRGAALAPLGVMLFTYARLKLMLDIGGCEARFHPYDWRLDLTESGAQLATRILREDRPVVLVGHSMGGLVARAAAALLPKRLVRRLILVGTPNGGTYAPVQALCGTYPSVRKIAMLDLKHSAEQLAQQVFSTFPGLYQLLPPRDRGASPDVYDLRVWPKSTSRPDAALLARAETARDPLAPPDERFAQIVGIAQDTIVGIHKAAGGFGYEFSAAGDGTVPLASARLPRITTHYVREIHGSLTNNSQVIHCILDLIRSGSSDKLPQRWSPGRLKRRTLTDKDLRRQFEAKIDWRKLDAAARERLMLQLSGNQSVKFEPKPRRKLELRIAYGNIADADGGALVVGIFRNVTPGGAAMAIDQRLDGAVREFTARRMFSADTGQIFTLPAGTRALRAKTVLFAGMGDFDQFDAEAQVFVSENVLRTLARAQVSDFTTVLFGTGSGVSMAEACANQLRGYLRALAAADSAYQLRRITFCVYDRKRLRQLRSALRGLRSGEVLAGVDATITEQHLEPRRVEARERAAPAPAVAASPSTAYLIISQQPGSRRNELALRASLLSAGARAAVLSCRMDVKQVALDALLNDLHGGEFDLRYLNAYGERLGKLLLPADMREALLQSRLSHLAIVHDADTSRLPWETLSLQGWTPALAAGMSRRYAAENLAVARWSETRRLGSTLEVLLVANPTQDLPGAQAEAERLIRLFAGHDSVRLHVVQGPQATRARLLSDFRSGAYDVLHYAGHAHFDQNQPGRSGIICAGGETLSGADLARLESLPALVFFNACESGRLRGGGARHPLRRALAITDGLAEAFLRGGVANYLGTYWPVGDEAALAFSSTLYAGMVDGQSLGAAVNRARAAVRAAHSPDWADYLHYGNHEFAIKGA